ncbi:hypothetical protein S7711_01883 [Stachybotrys chartarum IBT 7711]|uniref:Elongator complex protein 4 n=1 Tax=Stachybotrys chartarum (strain CBS 109288 / IBT 7711) TaxID=1280523 RepID=A0A084AMR0_STACB|nr:hypothetical protein S7711_01883 [Stachybotrys chartarum IBT 7711]
MSFRKRNVVLGSPSASSPAHPSKLSKTLAPGTRPSPLDGRITTSTGSASLDQVLAGHAGFPLGSSLLVEEAGTTDFGGILLRYYAAEGLVQGHHVHLLGHDESWRRELPGLSTEPKSKSASKPDAADDKMKIAWRYEALGNRVAHTRGMARYSLSSSSETYIALLEPPSSNTLDQGASPFCHSFDLTKRLEHSAIQGQLHCYSTGNSLSSMKGPSIFTKFIEEVTSKLANSPPSTTHRIVIPGLLSPTLYASFYCRPQEVLQFLHSLRGLLRRFSSRTSAIITMPISLFPRSSGMIRWAELLSDGVIELVPLQHQSQVARDLPSEDKTQGLLRIHSLPVFHEKGGGLEGGWMREDMSFKLSSSSGLVITPYSLPPIGDEDDTAKKDETADKKAKSLEF